MAANRVIPMQGPTRRTGPSPGTPSTHGMPECMDLEEQLIGAIGIDALDDNSAWTTCQDLGITPAHFYRDAHGRIFRAMLAVWEGGDPPLLSLVREELRRREGPEQGSQLYVQYNEATSRCDSSFFAPRYARAVLHTYHQREVLRLNGDLAGAVYANDTAHAHELEGQIAEHLAADTSVDRPVGISLADLATREWPEVRWVVQGLLPEGLTILAGGPKLGKSFLALNLALSVAAGGTALGYTSAEQGQVLYLALEDTQRRLVERAQAAMAGEPIPQGVDVETEFPTLAQGAMARIEQWIRLHPQARLVIVDTMAVLKGEQSDTNGIDLYGRDYATMRAFKKVADRHHLNILVLTHMRKSNSLEGDPLEEITGTMGQAGAADCVLTLKRKRGEDTATLFGTGRDMEDIRWAMKFDAQLLSWRVLGDADAVELTAAQDEIMAVLKEFAPVTPTQVQKHLPERSYNAIKKALSRMAESGKAVADHAGRYSPPKMPG